MPKYKFTLASPEILSCEIKTEWSKYFICHINELKSVTLVKPCNKKGFFLEDEKSLLEWAMSGPIISNILDTHSSQITDELKHHENTELFEKKFRKYRLLLLQVFEMFRNPFENPERGHKNIVSKREVCEICESCSKSKREAGG